MAGTFAGVHWQIIASNFPFQNEHITEFTGGKPLDAIDSELAALIIRFWLEETLGEIENLTIDKVAYKSEQSSDTSPSDLTIPFKMTSPTWQVYASLTCQPELDVKALADQLKIVRTEPKLPSSLQVEVLLSAGKTSINSNQLKNLATGDIIVLTNSSEHTE